MKRNRIIATISIGDGVYEDRIIDNFQPLKLDIVGAKSLAIIADNQLRPTLHKSLRRAPIIYDVYRDFEKLPQTYYRFESEFDYWNSSPFFGSYLYEVKYIHEVSKGKLVAADTWSD